MVSWELVKGQMQKAQHGSYVLEPAHGGTKVTYSLTVELAIPMIGMIKRKAERVIMDTALKELKRWPSPAGGRRQRWWFRRLEMIILGTGLTRRAPGGYRFEPHPPDLHTKGRRGAVVPPIPCSVG
jgi:hypothetical protein